MYTQDKFILEGSGGRKISLDISFLKTGVKKPVILFCHGFKGFKDWGHFPLVAKEMAHSGFVFCKFNFSHNGTTVEQPADFADLDAFGNNNYSHEMNDLGLVIDFVMKENSFSADADLKKIVLMGHSRGGGIALLKAAEDAGIKKVITWASIGDTEKRVSPQRLEEWKKEGVMYVENARTRQKMPLYYQFYEDFIRNRKRLDLVSVSRKIKIPVLLFHGTRDEAVHLEEAKQLHGRIKNSELIIVENGDHTFGGKHPYHSEQLPEKTREVIALMLPFLRK